MTISDLRKTDNFFLLAGPCVIEGEEMALRIADRIVKITDKLGIPYVFKGSYRKANRSRLDSFTGIGDEKALKVLRKVRETFGIPVVTDIHSAGEAAMAAEYVDVLQIPAFLCRQTDLLVAAAHTGKIVNIKKGQFLSPGAMRFAADKVVEAGNDQVMLTERGTTFGYQDLIVDYRGIPEMQTLGFPVILDVTHSLQPTSVPVDSTWVTAPDSGRLTRMAPKPIGSSRDGSISFLIASQINRPPIPHITTCCHCRFHRFPNSSCIHSPPCLNAILTQTAKRKRLPPRRGTTPMLGKSLALFHTNYGLSAVLT